MKNVKKIIYNTDGAKQHFKNRFQVANVVHHKEDFNIEGEWHYFATAHGKSAYDGLGTTFKREAYRASLTAKPNDSILTSEAIFNWGKKHFENKKINVFYYDINYYEKTKRKLNKRFEEAHAVPEISKQHRFIVDSCKNVYMKMCPNEKNAMKWSKYEEQIK